MKQLKEIEEVISQQKMGSSTGSFNWFLALKVALPATLIAGILGGIAYFDELLVSNPDLRKEQEARIEAYFAGLEQNLQTNPWGTGTPAAASAAEGAKAYVLSLFLGRDAEFLKRLSAMLDRISPEKLNYLVTLFKSIELDPATMNKFVALVDRLMLKEGAEKRLEVMSDVVKRVMENKLKAKQDEALLAQQKEEAQLDQTVEIPVVSAAEINNFLDKVSDAEVFENMYDLIANLPVAVGEKVKELVASLVAQDADKLTAVLRELDRRTIELVVDMLSRLNYPTISKLTERYDAATKEQIRQSSALLREMKPEVVEKYVDLSKGLTNQVFFHGVEFIHGMGIYEVSKLLNIGDKVGGGERFANLMAIVEEVGPATQNKALDLMNSLNVSAVNSLVKIAKQFSPDETKDTINLLGDFKTATLQQKAIDIIDNISISNARKAVSLLEDLNVDKAKTAVNIAYDFDKDTQNALIDRFVRIQTKPGSGLTPPVGNSKDLYGPQETRQKLTRVELLIDKLDEVNSRQKSTKLIHALDRFDDDASLNKAADVFIDLDIKSDKNRLDRFVRLVDRTDLKTSKAAVDTLDDLSKAHVNAAIDLADKSQVKFIADAVDFSEHMKKRLGRKEGLDSTMRAINVGVKFENEKEREDGLALLKTKDAKTTRKVLKQVDGQPDVFTQPTLDKMVKLHEQVGKFNGERFTKIIAGAEGFTVGGRLGGGGATRFVTQERKLEVIKIHFNEGTERPTNKPSRIEFFTTRTHNVNTAAEPEFTIKTPSAVAGVRGKDEPSKSASKIKVVQPDDS